MESVFNTMDNKFPRKPYKEVSASLSPQQMQQQNVNNAQQNPQQVQQHQPPSNNGKPTVVVLPPEEETYNQIKHTVAPELPNPALHMGSVYGECPHDGISEKSIGTLIGTNPKTEVHKFPYGTKDPDGYWWVLCGECEAMWEVILEDETGNLTLEEVEPGDGSCLKSFTEGGKKKELNTELSLEDKVRLKGLGVIGSINMNQTGLIGARNRYEPFLEKQGFKFVKIEKHSTPDKIDIYSAAVLLYKMLLNEYMIKCEKGVEIDYQKRIW